MVGKEHCFTVHSRGFSGGLALMWSSGVQLNIQSYSTWHINVKIVGIEGILDCFLLISTSTLRQQRGRAAGIYYNNANQLMVRLGSV